MMTAQQLALECLPYSGVFTIQPTGADGEQFTSTNERAAMLNRIGRDMTSCLQSLYRQRPELFRRRMGAVLSLPQVQTVTVAYGSTAITIPTPFAGNIDGCSVQVGGIWNHAIQQDTTVRLVLPFAGQSGDVPMTVYADCVSLGTTVSRVNGYVYRDDVIPLQPMADRDDFSRFDTAYCGDYGRTALVPRPVQHIPGTPTGFWTETEQMESGPILRLHVTPVPAFQTSLAFDVELRAPIITASSFGTNSTDPAVAFNLPAGLDESVLMPLVLAKWSRSTWFRDKDHFDAIQTDAVAAMKIFDGYQVQGQTGALLTRTSRG